MKRDDREQILVSIRASLARGPLAGTALESARVRLANPRPNLVPARAQVTRDEQVKLFVAWTERNAMTLERLGALSEVPSAVARYLAANDIQPRVRVASDPVLEDLDLGAAGLEVERGPAQESDLVGINVPLAAIAETGTLVVTSGTHSPMTLAFVPPVHVAIVLEDRIVRTLEDVWTVLRERYGRGNLPRAVTMLSSTSMTGDIDQRLVRGAHGPLRVHLLLVAPIAR